jgi:8-hydroxy-5-deazaflavin:NADPH oxidoreductase
MVNNQSVDQRRRTFLRISTFAATLLCSLPAQLLPGFGQAARSLAATMKIGVVGSGKLGGSVGSRWVKAGHDVCFSSRHPEALKGLVDSLGSGARAGTVHEAIAFGSVVLIAVPYSALPQIGRENANELSGKIVIDACNPIASRDGDIANEAMENGIGPTSMKYLPGTRLVRAFNPVGYHNFEGDAPRGGEPIGMPVAGDDLEAIEVAAQLVRDAGLEPVIVALARAMQFAPGTPLFGRALPAQQLRKQLGAAQ